MAYVEHEILKTLNAFLNTEGGTLIIGVSNDGEILGLENDIKTFSKGKDGFLLHFDNMIINSLGKEQQADINISFEKQGEKEFAIVEVSSSNKPIFLNFKNKEEFYVRHAASSRSYTPSEQHEYISKRWN